MLVLGGSTVLGQGSNQFFPPFQQVDPGSRPGPFATAASPWDNSIVDLEVQDTLVYCGMGDGLMILDISNPSAPELFSRIYFPEGIVRDLKLRGNYVYLCAGTVGTGMFRVIDISDPTAPFVAGSYPRQGASGLDVRDSLAFVAAANGINILNIDDPENIILVDSVPTDYVPERVRVRGDYAYAVDGDLYTIDISDPSEAIILSQFDPDFDYLSIGLDLKENDSLIYVADLSSIWPAYNSAFSVYNVADPENPSLWGRYPLSGGIIDVKVVGDIAYVGNCTCGLQVFDISDPTTPINVGRYQAPWDSVNDIESSAGRMAIHDSLLLLADIGPYMGPETMNCFSPIPEPGDPSPGDLIILDISEPTVPTVVGFYTPSDPTEVDDDDEPDLLPQSFALYQNYPNPFNPTTSIRFDLPQRSEIVLMVYNLLGQEVSRLVQTRSAGHHTIELNMRDQSSGVYLYELQTANFSETKKMLLLK